MLSAGAASRRTNRSVTGRMRRISFNGTETAGNESYLRHPRVLRGPELELADYENLCVHARFCMRPSGVWNLTERSDITEARETAIEEACNCPSGRLVLRERKTGNVIEPAPGKVYCSHRKSCTRGAWAALGTRRYPGGFCRRQTVHRQEPDHALPVREVLQQAVLRREPRAGPD